MQVYDLLTEHIDPNYKEFNASLIPTLNPDSMLGVRMPDVRRVAKELSTDEAAAFMVRFAIGTLMQFYLGEAFRANQVDAVVRTANTWAGEYYLDMMVAWYFATALYAQWDTVVPYLEQQRLATWTHNKAIQKAIESRRISPERKDYLRGLRVK